MEPSAPVAITKALLVIRYLLFGRKHREMTFKSFEELDCWQAAKEVRVYIEKIIAKLPASEKFDLSDNMKRAARSATRNIAEGFGRFYYQENIRFCRQSRGSQQELIDDLITCRDNNYITEEEYQTYRKALDRSLNILNGYLRYLQKQKDKNPGAEEPEAIYGINLSSTE